MQENTAERFAALDLLRGVATLCVLVSHSEWLGFRSTPLQRGHLAVDLFFVLSGFVIAHAYRRRLENRSQLRQFVLARLIRLCPLYYAATLLSFLELLVVALLGHGSDPRVTAGHVFGSLSTAILFLPTPGAWSVLPDTVFPLVFTAWSLFWELLVNFLYGIAAPRLRGLYLLTPIVAGAVAVAIGVIGYNNADLGGLWPGAWVGGARALFSFFAGVAVFRLRRRYRAPAVPALLLAILLPLIFVPGGFGGRAYDLSCIYVLFPLLIWFGADAAIGAHLRPVALFLGYLSYPMYLLQAPLLWGFAPASVRLAKLAPQAPLGAVRFAYGAGIVLASWLVANWFDSPVREALRRRYLRNPPIIGAQTAP